MKKTAWMALASLVVAIGLSACKSNGADSTAHGSSARAAGVAAPVTATWRPADKTDQFLSAFRPQE